MSVATLGTTTRSTTARTTVRPTVRPTGRPTTARTRSAEPALRLTARGRRVVAGVAALVALLVVGLVAVVLARPVGADPAVVPGGTATVVVGPGDSLWDIARTVAPGADPRAVVHEIERRNGVDAGSLHVGDELEVPAP